MIVAQIDRDYINREPGNPYNRVGKEFDLDTLHTVKELGMTSLMPKTRFRCKDDDGEVYYGGWLLNDSEGEVQLEVLRWCQADAGCTTIEVKLPAKLHDGQLCYTEEWKQEIG